MCSHQSRRAPSRIFPEECYHHLADLIAFCYYYIYALQISPKQDIQRQHTYGVGAAFHRCEKFFGSTTPAEVAAAAIQQQIEQLCLYIQ